MGHTREQVWVSKRMIPGSEPADFDQLSVRQLRRLLRMGNMSTDANEDKESLLRRLRFQVNCDDANFDSSLMPPKIHLHQLMQACFLVLLRDRASLNIFSSVV